MYQVLYRKWRPKVFADVAGQPQVTVTLKNELTAGRIAHAYLFTGSRGTGKTTCAKILAKAVNCLHPIEGDPCGDCEICRGVDNGSVMDVVEIDAASNNGVDNIRSLREEANFTPASAKYRVYIIDEVHMLSTGAFNALLKTLEEPPAHVIFILATTEVHKLPATILSRCQRFDFHRIAPGDIAVRLTYVAEQEGASLDRPAALLIARLADGALRDALSLLDQCMGRNREVTTAVVNETAGLAGREHLFELAEAIRTQNSAGALNCIDRLHNSSKDMARLCEELSAHFRGMMLIKTMKDAKGILILSDEEYELMTKQALSISLPAILHCLSSLQSALERMYRGGDRRIELEMALLRLCSPELENGTDALVRRIEALERALKSGGGPPASKPEPCPSAALEEQFPPLPQQPKPPLPSTAPPLNEPEALSQKTAGPETAGEMTRLAEWPEILQILKEYSVTIAAAFHGSSAYICGNYVLIEAKEMAFELLRRSPTQRNRMRDAINQVTGRVYKLGPYKPDNKQQEEDPLAALADMAKDAGIPVEQK